MNFTETDPPVTIADQFGYGGGPVVLANTPAVPAGDAGRMPAAWTRGAEVMKRQPGFAATRLHRGIAGGGVSLDHAVWEAAAHLKAASTDPASRETLADQPPGATATPRLFREVAVPGLCAA